MSNRASEKFYRQLAAHRLACYERLLQFDCHRITEPPKWKPHKVLVFRHAQDRCFTAKKCTWFVRVCCKTTGAEVVQIYDAEAKFFLKSALSTDIQRFRYYLWHYQALRKFQGLSPAWLYTMRILSFQTKSSWRKYFTGYCRLLFQSNCFTKPLLCTVRNLALSPVCCAPQTFPGRAITP